MNSWRTVGLAATGTSTQILLPGPKAASQPNLAAREELELAADFTSDEAAPHCMCHGLRMGRVSIRLVSASPMNPSRSGSQRSFLPRESEMYSC